MSLDQPNAFVKQQTVTRDAFLGGRLMLSQPRHGFRAGLDSVLLGASVARDSKRVLDLGSGVGTAALVALAHGAERSAVLAERDAAAATLARENIDANGFSHRAAVVEIDVAAKGPERQAAGLAENGFDAVIANPPFFRAGAGTLAAAARAGARHMEAGQLDLWVRTAAGCCRAGGATIFIYPAEGLMALLAAVEARFGAVTILPLCPREDDPASRILVRGRKGSKAPLTLLGSRALHEGAGRAFHPAFDAIFRGTCVLDW